MPRRPVRLAEGLRANVLTALLAALMVVLAYRSPAVLTLDLGSSPSGLLVEGFYESEGAFRWSRATSSIRFPDAGATDSARLTLQLSGFRPPGTATPVVVLEAGGTRTSIRPERRFSTIQLETETSGTLGSDLVVQLRSETFSPGQGDERALGVRVARAELALERGATPPGRQILLSVIVMLLLRRRIRPSPGARRALLAGALALLAAGYVWARVWTCLALGPLALALVAWGVFEWLAPSSANAVAEWLGEAARQTGRSARFAVQPRSLTLAALAVALVPVVHLASPKLVIDLGSGAAQPILRRFGPLDRDGDVTFRQALPSATIDLRDFGSSRSVHVTVRASAADGAVEGTWLRAGGREVSEPVGAEWRVVEIDSDPIPSGFRSGLVVELPGPRREGGVRIDRVVVDRGWSLPAFRPWLLVVTATLLVTAACLSALAGLVALAASLAALVWVPIVTVPLLPTLAVGALAALGLGAAARAALRLFADRGGRPPVPDTAVAIALGGFLVAFAVLVSPLYVGGHYTYHTNIAEEISRGAFLTYYLPYPENMLSRQPQWGGAIVPHPSLYHTLAAPAALLPGASSQVATKLLLAALGFGIALAAGTVATGLRGPRSGVAAALAAVLLPTQYQLLGLGHLMALFGTWAAALALGYVALVASELDDRRRFRAAAVLVTLCFLSYTGSLLFGSLVLLGAAAFSPGGATSRRRGLLLAFVGWAGAFALYYVHWTIPFLRDSVPVLLGGAGGGSSVDLLARILAVPGKLAYTFGAFWVPILGAVGLFAARPGAGRRTLFCWAGILAGFSVLDLFFNFLLKHHYFAYPAIAIGLGMALGWMSERGLVGRLAAGAVLLALAWLGVSEALAVAAGSY